MRWRCNSAPSRSSATNSIFVPPRSTPMRKESSLRRAILRVPFRTGSILLRQPRFERVGMTGGRFREVRKIQLRFLECGGYCIREVQEARAGSGCVLQERWWDLFPLETTTRHGPALKADWDSV